MHSRSAGPILFDLYAALFGQRHHSGRAEITYTQQPPVQSAPLGVGMFEKPSLSKCYVVSIGFGFMYVTVNNWFDWLKIWFSP